MKGEPHLVARAEQVAEAGLPLDTELMDTPWSARCAPQGSGANDANL
jgi:hypothetical protein